MANRIIVYFSAGGRTRKAAQLISKLTGDALYEIEAEIPYSKKDLNWMNKNSRSSLEMQDKSFRPKLKDKGFSFEAYDEILLGFPIWWYVAPSIIHTFLESHDFTGKKIILFATAGSSGFGNTLAELKASAPGAVMREGMVLHLITKKAALKLAEML